MSKNSLHKVVLWGMWVLLPMLGQTVLATETSTRAYTLTAEVQVSTSPSQGDTTIKVPFDSYIARVSFSANPKNISYCFASIEYPNASLRPDGSNTDIIARAEIPFIGNGSAYSAGSFNTTVPNMFVGEGVDLVLNAGIGGGVVEGSSPIPGCTVRALVYLIPVNTGAIAGSGGFTLTR